MARSAADLEQELIDLQAEALRHGTDRSNAEREKRKCEKRISDLNIELMRLYKQEATAKQPKK